LGAEILEISAGRALRPCSAHHVRKIAKSLSYARFVADAFSARATNQQAPR
jgi:hypothetical protein